jgi:hypothetical protein
VLASHARNAAKPEHGLSDVPKRELAHELADRLATEIRDADYLEAGGASRPAIGTTTALADPCSPFASRRGFLSTGTVTGNFVTGGRENVYMSVLTSRVSNF